SYHASVQIHRASSEMSLGTLRQKIQQAKLDEEELLLSPALFTELASRWKKIGCAQLSLKTGAYDNELSRFRYDIVLKAGQKEEIAETEQWLTWDEAGRWREDLERILLRQPDRTIGVRAIRHQGTAGTAEALRLLHAGDSEGMNVDELLARCQQMQGETPDELAQ